MVDHGLGVQQIQGGQQIGIQDFTTSGKRPSWLTGAIARLYFTLKKFNLLASPNLPEKMCLPHAVHSSGCGANTLD
jgi:hypothetical protein